MCNFGRGHYGEYSCKIILNKNMHLLTVIANKINVLLKYTVNKSHLSKSVDMVLGHDDRALFCENPSSF